MDDSSDLHEEVAELKKTVADLQQHLKVAKRRPVKSVRRTSQKSLFGLPLYCVALGPDPESGELRGHAKGIIAIGDIATGFLAIGGLARGFIAIGGLSLGIVAVGGCAVGAVAAVGGCAAGYFAVGGVAYGAKLLGGLRIPM